MCVAVATTIAAVPAIALGSSHEAVLAGCNDVVDTTDSFSMNCVPTVIPDTSDQLTEAEVSSRAGTRSLAATAVAATVVMADHFGCRSASRMVLSPMQMRDRPGQVILVGRRVNTVSGQNRSHAGVSGDIDIVDHPLKFRGQVRVRWADHVAAQWHWRRAASCSRPAGPLVLGRGGL